MFDQETLLEYLGSPEGINKIIVGIILVGAINAIFISISLCKHDQEISLFP